MFFSVIIPAYNCEKTIERCLNSVCLQIFHDFEVIIVDDGSSDCTGELCKSFADSDKRFLYYYKENGGVSSARNFGLSKASGKYITFLDSDDIYFSNYLADFYSLIIKHPEVEHFWCGYQYLSDNEEQKGREIIADSNNIESDTDRLMIMSLQEKELLAPIWNKVYIRDILMNNHILMLHDLSLGEDYLFNLEYLDCCSSTEIVVLNETNYGYYGFSNESLNLKYRRDLWNIYNRLLDVILQYLGKWHVSKEQKRKYYNAAFYMYDHVLKNTFHAENKDNILCKIRYNNNILRSKRFRKVLKCCNVSVNKNYMKLYLFRNYVLILLTDELLKLKTCLLKGRILKIKRKR